MPRWATDSRLPNRQPFASLLVAVLLGAANVPQTSPVAVGLKAFLRGRIPPAQLKITYSDLHPLHGGVRLSVSGSGEVEQEVVRQRPKPVRKLSSKEVRRLVELLVEVEAWKQIAQERAPVPDESRASLTLEVGGARSETWEWYNDLDENKRLIRIFQALQKLVWAAGS
jgi:hypothetical protein